MNQADAYFAYLLAEYKKLQKEQQRELRKLPPGQLSTRVKDGKKYYIQLFHESLDSSKQVRRGITQNQPLLHALARKKYLQQSLKLLDKNIPALEKLLKAHKAPMPDNIIKSLPKAYEELPPEAFLPKRREQNQWAEAEYEQNTYRQESKIHITGRGLKVRSKSEVIIADKLDAYGIPYHYDELIYIENQTLSPDFIILCNNGSSGSVYGSGHGGNEADGSYRAKQPDSADNSSNASVPGRLAEGNKLVYWEHCGMTGDPAYMRRHKWKLDMYEKAGIVPWKNLIITYDDEQGNIDARIIDAEIRLKLL